MIESQNLKAIAQKFESSAMWALRCVIYTCSFVYKGIPCLEAVKTLPTR